MATSNRTSAPDRRPRVHDAVTAKLGAQIASGAIAPGESLANEITLSETFGVSRAAVRESLRVLAAKGLVVARPRIGTIVREPSAWHLMDADVLRWATEGPVLDALLESLFEARRVVEPAAARFAAERATAWHLLAIENALNAMHETKFDREAHLENDYDFHAAVVAASGNLVFAQFGGLLRKALLESFARTTEDPDHWKTGLPLHVAVFEAIRLKDADAAERATNAVLDDAYAKVIPTFGDN